ncbi:MAG: PQQ-binding-like beta-propeller repeat protein [Anaerolineae bacterium]|jgi:outer membrane protein assembly factor BamB/tRNA A-37 threonylcarbamoyl transferase component Bud32
MDKFGTQHLEQAEIRPKETAEHEPEASKAVSVPPSAEELGTRHITPPAEMMRPESAPSQTQTPDRSEGRLPDGHMLQNRYRVLGILGFGGMSAVYKAQDMRFPKVVRLCVAKEMLNTATDPQVRAMIERNFEREANILATLSHPGIVQIFDYFSENNRSYLVEEYVDGSDLEALLADTEGFLPESQVITWAIQVCEVLSYLHSHEPRPIIFRDIKPSNIMLDSHNRIRLVDFGIARLFQSGQKGTMIGTEGYSPPEQYRGIAEPRVDIYALGATMHHLLSKQDPRLEPPFSFHERPIHKTNPIVSHELAEVIGRALEYDVNKRYGSAEELQRALLSFTSARSIGGTTTFGSIGMSSGEVMALWRFACEDEVRSSPAVYGDTLYIGAYDNNLYAINAKDGKFLWKYATEEGIASSPCVHEGRVFVGSSDKLLYAVSGDTGRILWTCPTQGKIWSSPKAAFGHVFFGSDDHRLYAANIHSGRVVWSFEAEGAVRSSPTVGEDAVYIGSEGGVVYAIDTSGQARWRFRARRGVTSSPAITKDMAYVGCQDWFVYGLDIRSGWSVWRYRTGGPIVSSPAADNGLVFIGSTDNHLYALDADNGRLVWRYETEGQVTSSPAVAEEAVYFGSVDGSVYSLDAKTGNLRWRFQTDGPVTSSPTVVDGVVYIGSTDRYVYALPA